MTLKSSNCINDWFKNELASQLPITTNEEPYHILAYLFKQKVVLLIYSHFVASLSMQDFLASYTLLKIFGTA